MRIAICEDERLHAEALSKIINQWANTKNERADLFVFQSAESFLAQWSNACPFDLLFLDIQMDKMTGMELAEEIRKTDESLPIIFVTGLVDFVLRGYKVDALDYLRKPVKPSQCMDALDKAKRIIDSRKSDTFIVPGGDISVRLFISDIYYFDATGHYVNVHALQGEYRFREKFAAVEEGLPKPRFCMCHRSVIVNVDYVYLIHREQVMLRDKNMTVLPVSKARWPALNRAFMSFHGRG